MISLLEKRKRKESSSSEGGSSDEKSSASAPESTSSSSSSSSAASSSSSSSGSSSESSSGPDRRPAYKELDKKSKDRIRVIFNKLIFFLLSDTDIIKYMISNIQKELFLIYDMKSKYQRIDEAATWESQKKDLLQKVVPGLTKNIRKKFNVDMQDVVRMMKVRHRTRHRQNTISKKGKSAKVRESRRMKKNTWLAEVSLF
jgi:hypothetical protein